MGTPIYRLTKTSRWGPNQQSALLSVDRPVDRPTVGFPTVEPPVDRSLDTESRHSLPVDRPVDRGLFQRAELSSGRPGWSTSPPAKQAVHVLCTSVDRPVDQQKAKTVFFRDQKFVIFPSIKSHKISKNLQK